MILSICSIYDKRTETFGTPFAVNHVIVAIDAFREGLENPQSFLSKHPSEYVLHKVGTMDDSTGLITPQSVPVVLAQQTPEA